MPGQGSCWPGTGPTLTWHLWAVTHFPRRAWVTSQTSLSLCRDPDLAHAAWGLSWPSARDLGLHTSMGPCPQGKKPPNQPGHRKREGGIELWTGPSNLIPSTGTPPSHHQGERMEGPQTSVQLPHPTGRTDPRSPWHPPQQRGHPFSHSLLPAGCAWLWTGVSSPHVKGNVSCPLPVLQQATAEPASSWHFLTSALQADSFRLPTDRGAFGRGEGSGWGSLETAARALPEEPRSHGNRDTLRSQQWPRVPGARSSGGSAARDGKRR